MCCQVDPCTTKAEALGTMGGKPLNSKHGLETRGLLWVQGRKTRASLMPTCTPERVVGRAKAQCPQSHIMHSLSLSCAQLAREESVCERALCLLGGVTAVTVAK